MITPPTSPSTGYVVVPNLDLTPLDLINSIPTPRVLHSHLRFERLPADHVNFGGKIILTVRNPKDVAVSLFHHLVEDVAIKCTLSWNSFLKYFMTENMVMGSYIDYLISWDHVIRTNKELKILVVYYESLIKNQISEMKNIRDFLGLSLDDVRLYDVIDKCSFSKLREVTNSRNNKIIAVDDNGTSVIFRKGIFSGVIGDWVNHFTVAQNKEFDKLISDKLCDTMFKFDYQPSLP